MRKKIVIFLWLSLVVLIIAFGLLVVYQNKQEAARIAEEARIEAELAAAHDASVYKVKGPRSVKAAGGTIPRSVRNRAKAREEAERAAEKQRAQNAKGKKSKK